jgi:hypothetical protein
MLDRHIARTGTPPRQTAADGGYASRANLAAAKARGVADVAFHKKCAIAITEMVKSPWVYRRLRNFRAGIEATISCFKRAYGAARCTWRGLDHFKKALAIATDRRRLSFDASTENEQAAKELDYLNAASVSTSLEIENAGSAIEECSQRAQAAVAEHAQAKDADRSVECIGRLAELGDLALSLDFALADFMSEFTKFEHLCAAISDFTHSPNRDIVKALSRRAVLTALAPKRQVFEFGELLQPSQRTTFQRMAQSWITNIEATCNQKLGIGPTADQQGAE